MAFLLYPFASNFWAHDEEIFSHEEGSFIKHEGRWKSSLAKMSFAWLAKKLYSAQEDQDNHDD